MQAADEQRREANSRCERAAVRAAGSFARTRDGYAGDVLWIILLIALIAIFGLGSVLEAAFVTLLVIAAVVIVVGLAIARLIGK